MRVICFGDSLTSCGSEDGRYSDVLQSRFPEHEIINKGVGGETFVDAKERLQEDVLDLKPDMVIVEFGANDWWQDERPYTAWAQDLEDVVLACQGIGAKVMVLGVFWPYRNGAGELVEKSYGIDERALAFRELEKATAERLGCDYIPNHQLEIIEDRCCWRDRNHPNENGNRSVASVLEPVLEKLLDCKAKAIRKEHPLTTRDMWDEAVLLAGDKLAAVFGDCRLTFAEAEAKVIQLAAGLQQATGVERPRVAVFLPNCLEYFLIYWAVAKVGGEIVPLNTWLKEDSLTAIFANIQPDAMIVQSKMDKVALKAAAQQDKLALAALKPSEGLANLADWFVDATPTTPEIDPGDVSIIMHTSGTTSIPKGAVMRHSDLIFNVMTTINAQKFVPSDVHLIVNPMFHATALYSSLPAAAYQKAPVIITNDTTPDGLLRLIETEHCSTFLTVPSILQRVVTTPGLAEIDTSSLRVIGYAGSFMPVKIVRALQAAFPEVALHNFFGLTETTSATHAMDGEATEERPASIGRLLPFVEAIIVNEDHNPVPADTVGELLFARSNVIQGYINQPGRLEEAFVEVDGRQWFNTGDLAAVDEEGYFFIKGRKKDMIIVGGENVYASEVEAAIMGLDEVRETAVKGMPATGIRESLGEMIRAFVVPEPGVELTETDIRRHCHRVLPSYKIPHVIEFLDALPRNPSGKVVKADLPV
ncbi:MAG: AMP-binding protein [Victivallales bacterium]|nr:AMP-binding protein [Victivallales bacterium]